MKYLLIIALFFSFSAASQIDTIPKIDTVVVRNLTMQKQSWVWLIGRTNNESDSIGTAAFFKIRTVIFAATASAFSGPINVDSLPGSVVVNFYQATKSAMAGEAEDVYNNITSKITLKTNLTYFLGPIDRQYNQMFRKTRTRGKHLLMDN